MEFFSEHLSLVPKSGTREMFDLAQQLDRIIDLGIGEPDYRTPKFIRDRAKNPLTLVLENIQPMLV